MRRDPDEDRDDETPDPERAGRFVGDGSELNFGDEGDRPDPFAGDDQGDAGEG